MSHFHMSIVSDKYINAVDMPAFFILSGWAFSGNRSLIDCFKKEFWAILVPYILFSAILLINYYLKHLLLNVLLMGARE